MKQEINIKYKRLFTTDKRYIVLMGGRGAGRSTVASQYANAKLTAPEYFRCAIMRYILGDIRNSIYREIKDRAEENGIIDTLAINDSGMIIEYGQNTINAVGFKKSSGDQKAKLKSLANYNCIIIEEADEIGEADFIQLDDSLRTIKGDIKVILLLNPPAKDHWIISRWFDLEESEQKGFYVPKLRKDVSDVEYLFSDFEDNIKNIDIQTIQRYRNYKTSKPDHYYNMIRGYVPETVRGKVYSNWQIIDEIPHEAILERYGLDFGYTNDPTAIVGIYKYNGGYILDEICYTTDMSNPNIANTLKSIERALTIADSSEPKSIDEITAYGLNVQPAVKGQGSVKQGIQFVKAQKISVTRRSTNIIKEYNNYSWLEDKDGNALNEPKDIYNHAMDAIRYAFSSIRPRDSDTQVKLKNQFARNEYRANENSSR